MTTQPRVITREALGYAEGLGGWTPCAELEAVNWTPWWGGDHEAKVRDPVTLRVTSLPRSETLKGVLRWVLRAALNAHLDTDIETLDEILAPIYGGVVRVGKREEHLDSLVRIIVEPSLDASCDAQAVKQAVTLVQKKAEQSAYLLLGKKRDDYTKILTVTRVELQFLGKNPQERVALLPVPARCLRLRIRVELAEDRLRDLDRFYSSPPTPDEVCALTTAAVIYALSVKGIGRGANRGFGRFEITKLVVKGATQATQLKSLAVGLARSATVQQALHQIHAMLVNLAAKLATYKWGVPKPCGGCAPSLKPVPPGKIQHGVLVRVKKLARHPAPVPVRGLPKLTGKLNILDVYDALSAIGKAFTKNVWKLWSTALQGNASAKLRSPGVGFHSWIAGLPRYQRATGYAIVKERMGDNVCVAQRGLRGVEPGRRQSSIVAYPMPDRPDVIVLIAYVNFGDHLQYLQPGHTPALYHLGRHGGTSNPWRHVVRVEWAARHQQVPRPPGPGNCGQDSPAGVVYPNVPVTAVNPQDLIEKAYDSVLKHIDNVM